MPVTVWLSGEAGPGALLGLTVSSLVLAQGEPPMLAGLLAPGSELAETVCVTGARFVVHLLRDGDQRLAQHFSGELPAPAEQLVTQPSGYGPVLSQVTDRLACRCLAWHDFGWSLLVQAQVDEVTVGPARPGLAWYHGAFRSVPSGRR